MHVIHKHLEHLQINFQKVLGRISSRISGVIGHVIGKLIWVSGSGHTRKQQQTIIKFCFQRRGNCKLRRARGRRKSILHCHSHFHLSQLAEGLLLSFSYSPQAFLMLLILRSNISDGQTTFEQALKLIYPKCLFSSWIRKKRQLHATYRRSQWLPKWPKKQIKSNPNVSLLSSATNSEGKQSHKELKIDSKIPKNIVFVFFNFGNFHQFLSD